MIDRANIESNLTFCGQLYRSPHSSSSEKLAPILCKTAIIELHGWVETSLENICREFVNTHVSSKKLQDFARSKIKRNNGVGYDTHIRPLFCNIFGLKLTQELECRLSLATDFRNNLRTIGKHRNQLAHSFIQDYPTIQSLPEPNYLIVEWLPRIADKLDEIKSYVEVYGSDAR